MLVLTAATQEKEQTQSTTPLSSNPPSADVTINQPPTTQPPASSTQITVGEELSNGTAVAPLPVPTNTSQPRTASVTK
jgi:hypothetical protein